MRSVAASSNPKDRSESNSRALGVANDRSPSYLTTESDALSSRVLTQSNSERSSKKSHLLETGLLPFSTVTNDTALARLSSDGRLTQSSERYLIRNAHSSEECACFSTLFAHTCLGGM
jgi:hypothetical protein